jgi:hypothetical protein
MNHATHALIVVLVVAAVTAHPARAQGLNVPDPSRCTVASPYLSLEGQTGGRPDSCSDGRCGDLAVTIRDFAGDIIAGSGVVIDFTGCPDLTVSCNQLNAVTGQTDLPGKRVLAVTNALGKLVFKVQGAANAPAPGRDTAPGTRAGVACAQLYADGVRITSFFVSAYDVDGLGSPDTAVDGADVKYVVSEVLRVLLGGTARARDDYNGDNRVDSTDASRSAAMSLDQVAGTGSRSTAPFCP